MDDEQEQSGISGADEPQWGEKNTEDGRVIWTDLDSKPDKYYPDGKPILSDDLLPAGMKWAMLFEQDRSVGQTKTLYGERLSTVWLGLDHSFSRTGPPLIFETMLFAPRDKEVERKFLHEYANNKLTPETEADYDKQRAYLAKHYPHDQLQLRYSTRAQAEDKHEQLKLQCLIPPRWRHFLLGRVCGDPTWLNYDEEVEQWWT